MKPSTQQFLPIDQIREGVIILKNKGLRSVLMVSSLNFALKSEDEQMAILYQFQNFLNSLDFSYQIVVSSRKLNLTGYLDKLEQIEKNQQNPLLKYQIKNYKEFIAKLIEEQAIMTKNFYVVIPYSLHEAVETNQKSSGILPKKPKIIPLTEENFQRAKTQLWQRIEFVILGLKRCGLKAIPLGTADLIELFWSLHHPFQAEMGYYPELPPELANL
jgi:hypothetical protein